MFPEGINFFKYTSANVKLRSCYIKYISTSINIHKNQDHLVVSFISPSTISRAGIPFHHFGFTNIWGLDHHTSEVHHKCQIWAERSFKIKPKTQSFERIFWEIQTYFGLGISTDPSLMDLKAPRLCIVWKIGADLVDRRIPWCLMKSEFPPRGSGDLRDLMSPVW